MIQNKILQAFEEACQRNTRQRKRIAERLAELAASDIDFTIEDLWHDLKTLEPHLGRATLYRAVEILVEKNILDRIEFADGTHRYHVFDGEKHHHLTCIQCHRFVEVLISLPLDQMSAISTQTNFSIEGLSLTLFGRCAACRF